MGLLDSVLGSLSQGGSGSGGNPLLDAVLSMVNNPQTGGLAGLLQKLQESGLGNVADSWVSTGKKLPISPEQLQNALGSGELGSLAGKLATLLDCAALGRSASPHPRIIFLRSPLPLSHHPLHVSA